MRNNKKQMILIQFDNRKQYETYVRFKNKWLENGKQVTKRMEKMLSDEGLEPKAITRVITHNDGMTYENNAKQIVL